MTPSPHRGEGTIILSPHRGEGTIIPSPQSAVGTITPSPLWGEGWGEGKQTAHT